MAGRDQATSTPQVTPLWFVWEDRAFHLTSFPDRHHLRRLESNPRAGLCIDVEEPERDDGERPNRQVRAADARTVIRIRPLRLVAVASV
jgi:hypothetical protein